MVCPAGQSGGTGEGYQTCPIWWEGELLRQQAGIYRSLFVTYSVTNFIKYIKCVPPTMPSCVINNAMWKKRSIKDQDHRSDLPLCPDNRTPDRHSDSISADRSSHRHCSTDLVPAVGPMMLRRSRSRRLCRTIDRSAPPTPTAPSRRQQHHPRHHRRSRQPTIQNPIMTPSRIRSLIAAATDRCRRRPHDEEGYAVAHELAPSHPAPRAAAPSVSDQVQYSRNDDDRRRII